MLRARWVWKITLADSLYRQYWDTSFWNSTSRETASQETNFWGNGFPRIQLSADKQQRSGGWTCPTSKPYPYPPTPYGNIRDCLGLDVRLLGAMWDMEQDIRNRNTCVSWNLTICVDGCVRALLVRPLSTIKHFDLILDHYLQGIPGILEGL